ncbi:phosphodiesterase [Arthrobacter sp. ISL-85]|uniref:phosphodiesterase n=1 Tax=Arthrobacter sp. ISL-85 TaxID=2819115 RepID=UPI001BE64DBE|nr:phosphodiesterase [Arthrobacter sp. ISL-85]MBT2566303.1 phosphodiesterase [Arthrobacter sp. ISL-85]
MQQFEGEHPGPNHVLVHVSDPHFVGDGLLYGGMDPRLGLVEVLDVVEAAGPEPEAIIFSGDLADQGSAEAYRELRAVCGSYAARMGCRLIWAMGNHDERGNFQRVLLEEPPLPGPVDRRYDLGGLRVLVLDSSTPGVHHGQVSVDQLRWLDKELEEPADDGTLLVIHHPPVPVVQDLAVLSELRGQEELARVLSGSDVIGILAGHAHCSLFSTFAGIPVSVASSTSYTQDLALPPGAMQGVDGARSFNLLRIHGRTLVTAVVPVGDYPRFGEPVSAEETRHRLEAAGVSIAEPASKPAGGTVTGRG